MSNKPRTAKHRVTFALWLVVLWPVLALGFLWRMADYAADIGIQFGDELVGWILGED